MIDCHGILCRDISSSKSSYCNQTADSHAWKRHEPSALVALSKQLRPFRNQTGSFMNEVVLLLGGGLYLLSPRRTSIDLITRQPSTECFLFANETKLLFNRALPFLLILLIKQLLCDAFHFLKLMIGSVSVILFCRKE